MTQTKKRFFILSVRVTKFEGTHFVNSVVHGHRVCETEDEAMGGLYKSATELKKGFLVEDILCSEITKKELEDALEIMK